MLAWGATVLVRRSPTKRRTYGLRRSSILAALINALLLLVAIGAIAWEAVGRLQHPQPVASAVVMGVAAIGLLVNGVTAWLFAAGIVLFSGSLYALALSVLVADAPRRHAIGMGLAFGIALWQAVERMPANPVAGGACTGGGIGPLQVDEGIGVGDRHGQAGVAADTGAASVI